MTTSKNPALSLLVITEFLSIKRTLKPFFKDENDISALVNTITDDGVDLKRLQRYYTTQMLRKLYGTFAGNLFKKSTHFDFMKMEKEHGYYAMYFTFKQIVHDEPHHIDLFIKFKKSEYGKIEAYKGFDYTAASGRVFTDLINEVNQTLNPVTCEKLIVELFKLD